MTFGSSGTGAGPERGHPAFSLMTYRGTKKPGVPLCGGTGPKVLRGAGPKSCSSSHGWAKVVSMDSWQIATHSVVTKWTHPDKVTWGLLGKRPQDQIKLIFD